MKWLAKIIYFKWMRWKLIGNFPSHKKFVITVLPHTSWHDFYVGLLVRKIVGLNINFVAKKQLFKPPFGWYFRWMGGAPIDRSKTTNKVQAIVDLFNQRDEFRLTITPEGTRKKVTQWKTGFYYIAKQANVPIVMVAFDFGKKQVKISEPFYTTANKDADFKHIREFYKGVVGKVPEYS